jgi:hypothetical protein
MLAQAALVLLVMVVAVLEVLVLEGAGAGVLPLHQRAYLVVALAPVLAEALDFLVKALMVRRVHQLLALEVAGVGLGEETGDVSVLVTESVVREALMVVEVCSGVFSLLPLMVIYLVAAQSVLSGPERPEHFHQLVWVYHESLY